MQPKLRNTLILSAVALIVFGAVVYFQHRQHSARAAKKAAVELKKEAPHPWIISLLPSVTETICMLGLEEHLIGRSKYCDFPPSVTNLPAVGSYGNANIEEIARMKPDFVLMADLDTQSTIHDALAKFRISHLGVKAMSLSDITDSVWNLAEWFDATDAAAIWLDRINDLLESARASAPAEAPKVLFCAGRDPGSLDRVYISGKGNFYEDIVVKCGGVNAYDGGLPTPMVSAEGVMTMNPDIIVDVLVGATEADVRKAINDWARLTSVKADKSGSVHTITDPWAARPGPRIGFLIEAVSRYIHDWDEKR
ncbi:MAG: helical backbone metal receptor [Kiritimatiellaeota bacterium]|nr:helical backbone metal receptor [Kiritimatiellota bacterium]